jgi:hypothetical protein
MLCAMNRTLSLRPAVRPLSVHLSDTARVSIGGAVAFLALGLPLAFFTKSALIAGERYWWLADDAMISMRYGHNLASGLGLVWNAGDRVEGYTNFLWTLYMALVHLFPIPLSQTSLVILLTSLVISAATVPFLVALIREIGGSDVAVLGAVAAFALSNDIMHWTTAGLETPLLAFLFLWGAVRILEEARAGTPQPLTYVGVGLLALVRADGIALMFLLYAVSLLLSPSRKPVLVYASFSLLLPFGQEVFRLTYYGDLLPNTAYLKTSNWDGRYLAGLNYVLDFAKSYALLLVLALFGSLLIRERRRLALAGLVTLYAMYVAFVGGDAFLAFRFFVPVLPAIWALAFANLEQIVRDRRWQFAVALLSLLSMPLIVRPYAEGLKPREDELGNLQLGLSLAQNTSARTRVADFWAGSVFYFSDTYAIDLLGKSDRYIAHLPARADGMKPGHNKFDFDYSLGALQPDFVVANFHLSADGSPPQVADAGDYAFTGQLYIHPIFREHCLSQPLPVDTWRTVFACQWPEPR